MPKSNPLSIDAEFPEAELLVRAGRAVDGLGGPQLGPTDILTKGERIVEIGPRDAIRIPRSVEVIDAPETTAMPGLVDAHYHVSYCGHIGMAQLESPASLEYQAVRAVHNAATALHHGITSAMDVGGRGSVALAVRQALKEKHGTGPDLRVSGQMIDAVGGCIDLWPPHISVHDSQRLGVFVSGVEEMRRAVRQQLKLGVDNIKLLVSGSSANPTIGSGSRPTLTVTEIRAAVELAHDNDVTVAAHAESSRAIQNAVAAGVDSVHHLTGLDDAAIECLLSSTDTFPVFTLGVYRGIIDADPALGYPVGPQKAVTAIWPGLVRAVQLAADANLEFAVGSDCGGAVHPHGRYAEEISLLVEECGLQPTKAIQAATRNAALAAGFTDRGWLGAGARADILLVAEDVTSEVGYLLHPERLVTIIQGGAVMRNEQAITI